MIYHQKSKWLLALNKNLLVILYINLCIYLFIIKYSFFDIFKINNIKLMPGDCCERVIPDPIPNSEVKPFCANGTLS